MRSHRDSFSSVSGRFKTLWRKNSDQTPFALAKTEHGVSLQSVHAASWQEDGDEEPECEAEDAADTRR